LGMFSRFKIEIVVWKPQFRKTCFTWVILKAFRAKVCYIERYR
jgi:hypothetical protein